eukprot:2670955-Rhodomonas_salina.1
MPSSGLAYAKLLAVSGTNRRGATTIGVAAQAGGLARDRRVTGHVIGHAGAQCGHVIGHAVTCPVTLWSRGVWARGPGVARERRRRRRMRGARGGRGRGQAEDVEEEEEEEVTAGVRGVT